MRRNRMLPAELRRATQQASAEPDAPASRSVVSVDPYGSDIERGFDVRAGDDMAERDREIGRRTHALVAAFCRSGVAPEPTRVWVTTCKVFAASPMSVNHGARQRAACAVGSYFARFHREQWEFVGAEVDLGTGRVDLAWRTPESWFVLDELKMGGLGDVVDDADTVRQVARYAAAGSERWGEQFAGVRLLPLTAPGRALFCPPQSVRIPLRDAPAGVK